MVNVKKRKEKTNTKLQRILYRLFKRQNSGEIARNDFIKYFFEKGCESLEKEAALYTLKELHVKVCELAESTDVIQFSGLKTKLKEIYEEVMFFGEIKSRTDVVCFKDLASYLINDKWYY